MVTIAELESGVLAAKDSDTRALRLRTLRVAEQSQPLPITRGTATRFAQLRATMRKRGQARLISEENSPPPRSTGTPSYGPRMATSRVSQYLT